MFRPVETNTNDDIELKKAFLDQNNVVDNVQSNSDSKLRDDSENNTSDNDTL